MMNKQDYLDALRRALAGLPPDLVAKTLDYYEQTFIEGAAAGRSEHEIADDLGDPKKIALTLRSSTHRQAFEQKKTPVNLLRLLVSLVGLAIFNLFMVVPAAVYAALLATLYAVGLSFYLAGIAITASGLSGANELVLDGPLRHVFIHDDDGGEGGERRETRITIGDTGIEVDHVPGPVKAESTPEAPGASSRMMERAEALAGGGIRISTDMDRDARTTQTVFGVGMLLGGIAIFLLSLVVTRYTLIGIKRYVAMNVSLLKGH
ncbi:MULTISPECIES: DUF1700 domain-containing protein [unclassified Janthinobacterium]|uniref:DUF1700 domain-containing protein n=1 Tax=unclassified Janthinobacterium TaxID=2610881 RepID=UPI0025B30F2C|nr:MULTISPECIES: DUF1700 domain-containing protein [unclassified Janthinobacterium]MDN2676475.1 DUF1700 domain-containing protein [Janthinobacterium sp. SUN033]MDN2700620.1 DUF1700 domain-containing protein [Janthinobacterium sp. SUN100]MDO8040072.1 DUF1700 domain-containing protein [Janthinobacterium sp. SUN137]